MALTGEPDRMMDKKKVSCQVCGKSFDTVSQLKVHTGCHDTLKPKGGSLAIRLSKSTKPDEFPSRRLVDEVPSGQLVLQEMENDDDSMLLM